jgi:hypothetical protein
MGVDPARIFARKPGGSRYVGDVYEMGDGLLPGCGHAEDTCRRTTSRPQPPAERRLVSRRELRRHPRQGRLSVCGERANVARSPARLCPLAGPSPSASPLDFP